jgi:hypothetical protein
MGDDGWGSAEADLAAFSPAAGIAGDASALPSPAHPRPTRAPVSRAPVDEEGGEAYVERLQRKAAVARQRGMGGAGAVSSAAADEAREMGRLAAALRSVAASTAGSVGVAGGSAAVGSPAPPSSAVDVDSVASTTVIRAAVGETSGRDGTSGAGESAGAAVELVPLRAAPHGGGGGGSDDGGGDGTADGGLRGDGGVADRVSLLAEQDEGGGEGGGRGRVVTRLRWVADDGLGVATGGGGGGDACACLAEAARQCWRWASGR